MNCLRRIAVLVAALTCAVPAFGQSYMPDIDPQDLEPRGALGGNLQDSTRWWASAEYLLWWMSPMHSPALVTTSPQSSLGVLGRPGTTVLYGGNINLPAFSGGRFTSGYWFDCAQTCGIEGSFFFLGQNASGYSASSGGNPLLARPFINALTNTQDSELVANLANPADAKVIPLTGTVSVHTTSALLGADLNGIFNVCNRCFCGGSLRIDVLGGFRFLSLGESLEIQENLLIPTTSAVLPGSSFKIVDQFSTQNYFYGGQIGARGVLDYGSWELCATGKMALGVTRQQVSIQGSTLIDNPASPPPVFSNVGFLASSSNIGNYSRDVFAVVPEIDLTLGYRLTANTKVFVGASALLWSDVARPGDQMDVRLNPNQIPGSGLTGGPRLPAFTFHGTDLFVYGISVGFEWRY